MKKNIYFCIIISICILFSGCLTATSSSETPLNKYGVFIGAGAENMEKFYNYEKVIIDASYFSKEQIDSLHEKNISVYSYINLGAIEDFRPYYKDYVDITLSAYENWEEERWVDVSNPTWQNFFVHTLAKDLLDKNIDGLFIDNLDIYYLYPTDAIYEGIKNILLELKSTYHNIPIIINGGYEFVQTSLAKDIPLTTLLDGINHESVFSKIDFDNNVLTENTPEDRDYLLDYFKEIQKEDVAIYIIEYTTSPSLIKKLKAYYNKTNYTYYISSGIELQ